MVEFAPPPPPDFSRWKFQHTPFEDQAEALQEILASKHGTVLLPTGSGKTSVGTLTILELRQPTVILVPTKVLLDQWVIDLGRSGIRAGVWFGEEKRPGFVTVSTYQSLFSNPELVRSFPVLIMDEGDLTTGDVWGRILTEAKQHPYAVILTATLPTDPTRRQSLLERFPILLRRRPREMIAAGRFVPVDVEEAPVELSAESRAEYAKLEVRRAQLVRAIGTGNPEAAAKLIRTGTVEQQRAAGAYLRVLSQRREILARVPARAVRLLDIARKHPAERILVFGTLVDVVSDACAYLTMSGVPCRVISGETTPDNRRYVLNEWGRSFFVLGSVDVLTRGFNVPEAGIAVIMGGGTGERRLIQRVGRIVRPAPGKPRALVYVIYAENTSEDKLPGTARRLFKGEPEATDGGEPE
jgi:superfamily II DNA or RNA helicase